MGCFWAKRGNIRSLTARHVLAADAARFPAWMAVIRPSIWMDSGALSSMRKNVSAVIFVCWYVPPIPSVHRERGFARRNRRSEKSDGFGLGDTMEKKLLVASVLLLMLLGGAGYLIGSGFVDYALYRANPDDPTAIPEAAVAIVEPGLDAPAKPQAESETWTILIRSVGRWTLRRIRFSTDLV